MFDKGRAEALSNKPKTSATFKITQRLQLFKITIGMQIYIYASYNLLNLSSRGSLRSSIWGSGPNKGPVKFNGSKRTSLVLIQIVITSLQVYIMNRQVIILLEPFCQINSGNKSITTGLTILLYQQCWPIVVILT